MRRLDWDKLVPPGLDGWREAKRLLAGLAAALAWNVWMFVTPCIEMRQRGQRDWTNRWAVPFFSEMLRVSFLGFAPLAVWMPLLAGVHYLYHYRDGRSIYLMRRLPDRWELHRRCLFLPLAGLLAVGILSLALAVGYFFLYRWAIPEGLIPGPEWQGIWYRWMAGVFLPPGG